MWHEREMEEEKRRKERMSHQEHTRVPLSTHLVFLDRY
jgi:hypothetical protein